MVSSYKLLFTKVGKVLKWDKKRGECAEISII